MAYHRSVESGDASAMSHKKTGPFGEPEHLCVVSDWIWQGTDGFLGHGRCQGRTVGLGASRHEALILMGLGAAPTRPTPGERQQGCVCGHTSGGVCQAERNDKIVYRGGIAS